MQTPMYTYIYILMHIHICICVLLMCLYMYIYMNMCMHMFVDWFAFPCIYVCICLYGPQQNNKTCCAEYQKSGLAMLKIAGKSLKGVCQGFYTGNQLGFPECYAAIFGVHGPLGLGFRGIFTVLLLRFIRAGKAWGLCSSSQGAYVKLPRV